MALDRCSPWKFTVGFPGSSGGAVGRAPFGVKLLRPAHASMRVPSTLKCSSESSWRARAWARTRPRRPERRRPEKPLPVRACRRWGLRGVVHAQAHEPAEEQVVIGLFHELTLAADRVEHLEEQRTQEPFGGN